MIALLIAFCRAFRTATALRDERENHQATLRALEAERWAADAAHHRAATEARMLQRRLDEANAFIDAVTGVPVSEEQANE